MHHYYQLMRNHLIMPRSIQIHRGKCGFGHRIIFTVDFSTKWKFEHSLFHEKSNAISQLLQALHIALLQDQPSSTPHHI